jgi:hypothetical protein
MLSGLAERITPVPSFWLSFFPEVVYHETEEVIYDVVEDKPRITPFVHPMREGKLIEAAGFSSNTIKPAYTKDKRVHNPNRAFKRMAGEPLTGAMTNEQRLRAALVADLADQRKMLSRRFEVMAGEAVIYGTQTIVGDGFNATVDFGRHGDLTDTLAGGEKWDAGTPPDIGAQLEDWDLILFGKCGGNTSHVVMDALAWKLLKNNTKFLAQLDLRRGTDSIAVDLAPMLRMPGVVFKGYYGEFPLFVYSHSYVDPETGSTAQVMPNNTVVMVSQSAMQGVRHFGAIHDLDAGLRATEAFTKSWTVQEPSQRILLQQAAPIMVPYVVNGVLRRVVA